MHSPRILGQALVEFALVLPFLMFLLLGFGEVAFLVATQQSYQNGVDVLAQWAASEMSEKPGESWRAGWNAVVKEESDRTGCGDLAPVVIFPDINHSWGDRVLVQWDCQYTPKITSGWGGLRVSVESEAVVPGAAPLPAPEPS